MTATRAQRRPVAGAAPLAVFAFVLLSVFASSPSSAEYATVANGLTQWVWARTASDAAPPITAVAVRDDGHLIVATSPDHRRARNYKREGGELHVIRAEGEVLSPANRLGPTDFGFSRIVVRSGRIYGLTTNANDVDEVGQRARLLELDASTGALLRDHGVWWWPELTVDPVSGDLVVYEFACQRACSGESEDPGRITHDLVRYNPDTGRRAILLRDPTTSDIGGSTTCRPGDTSGGRCENVYRVALTRDGAHLLLASARSGANAIEVRDRAGTLVRQIESQRPADAIAMGLDGTCFAGALLASSSDGTVVALRNLVAGVPSTQIIAAGAPPGVSTAAIGPAGHVVASRRTEVGGIACAGAPPVPAPARPPDRLAATTPQLAPSHVVETASVDPTVAAAAPANAPPPPPPAGPPPATPIAAGPPAHGAQAVAAPGGALADAPEEQPVYGLSASARSLLPPAWATLGAGLLLLAGAAYLALDTNAHTSRRLPLARTDTSR